MNEYNAVVVFVLLLLLLLLFLFWTGCRTIIIIIFYVLKSKIIEFSCIFSIGKCVCVCVCVCMYVCFSIWTRSIIRLVEFIIYLFFVALANQIV